MGEGWVKYVHNGTARLRTFAEDSQRHRAEFLTFTQHVQWTATKGMIFISDYQGQPEPRCLSLRSLLMLKLSLAYAGGRSLLTDPQIMTSP
jgi:hypothetical protein